ncbi:MAG: methyltransferase domain-containing protein [Candidatus Colwellbacteria bacterium]|nr:methyltransferase domain-containing protein [Candidatus Colwellbacteria bacterium]
MPITIHCERDAVSGFWENFWKEKFDRASLETYYKSFRKTPRVQKILIKYLPKDGKILDSGCGSGIWTHWLKEKGYNVEGIDISKNTISFIKKNLPDLPVRTGTVFALDYPDKSLKGYLSFGVIGYFLPDKILNEAARVLDKEGVVILRVPYANPLRKFKSRLGFYSRKRDYSQYAFTSAELASELKARGFKFIKSDFFDSLYGFYTEISGATTVPLLSTKKTAGKLRGESLLRNFMKSIFEFLPIRFLFSHNLIVVAKKL